LPIGRFLIGNSQSEIGNLMSYAQIEISEVGPAEYSLIKVLRETIFGAYKHRFAASFDEVVAGAQDVLALIAHLEGNPVGYKIGYRYSPGRYHSRRGGELPDYRRSGLARRMQEWQHGWCRSRGYKFVQFNTFNKFKEMLLFGLSSGFLPVGVDFRPEKEMSIKFEKDLSLPDPPKRPKQPPLEDLHVEAVGPNFHGLIARFCTEMLEPVSEEELDREMEGKDALALLAFVGKEPVGFKIGRGRYARGRVFESRMGGVLPQYRSRGVAKALALRQISEAEARGYQTVRVHVRHDNPAMISMCLKARFDLTGAMTHPRRGDFVVRLERSLG
jgi:GNAT superfamily N-acetyltransferase